MISIMSEFHALDSDDLIDNFDMGFSGELDFGGDPIPDIQVEHNSMQGISPSRSLGESPSIGSDGSTGEQATSADNSNQNFPVLLHEIVSNDEYDCIHWLPCGTKFNISNKEIFTAQVIPRYFDARGGTKFTSFTRRLKRWNFSRVAAGSNIGSYYHNSFLKNNPDLAATIVYPAKTPRKKNPLTPPLKSAPIIKSKNKARRRASTGCMANDIEKGFTPIPIKPEIEVCADSGLFDMDKDMAEFLASSDFCNDHDDLFARPEKTVRQATATPPFSSSDLEPVPVTDFSLKQTACTSAQQKKVINPPSFYTLKPSPFTLNMMQQIQMQQVKPLTLPGTLRVDQQQMRQPTFQPQMRRHSCLSTIGSNNFDSSPFGRNQYPTAPPTSAFNPFLQVNNMHMNQMMARHMMMSIKNSEIHGRKVSNAVEQRSQGTTLQDHVPRDADDEDKCIDFDEYIARIDDDDNAALP